MKNNSFFSLPFASALVLALLALVVTPSHQSIIPGSENWALVPGGSIDEVILVLNNTSPEGGMCNIEQSAANIMCKMLNKPVPSGKQAGLLFAPFKNINMYVDGISCADQSATNLGACDVAKFDATGRACDPLMAFGVDCSGYEIVPSITFYTYFKPKQSLFDNMNSFLITFKSILEQKLDVKRARIRVMGLSKNATTGIVNCTWHFLEGNANEVPRTTLEFIFLRDVSPTFFYSNLNLQSMHYAVPPTPAPPNHDLGSWTFKLSGTSKFNGRLEVQPAAGESFGTVCGPWVEQGVEADAVCKKLGYTNTNPFAINHMTGGTGPIWMWNVDCYGINIQHQTIENCKFKTSYMTPDLTTCTHSQDVGVDCFRNTDPMTTPAPGTTPPPYSKNVVIMWNATISKSTWQFFVSGLAQWMTDPDGPALPESRISVLKPYTKLTSTPVPPLPNDGEPEHGYVLFRFTDGYNPGREVLDLDLANYAEDMEMLTMGTGIIRLTTNLTDPAQAPSGAPKIQWEAKIGAQNSFSMGLAYVRPQNATHPQPWGSVCTGAFEYPLAANAICKSAGKADFNPAAGVIPWHKTPAPSAAPIYMTDIICNAGETINDCEKETDAGYLAGGCTNHVKDMGVVCFTPSPAATANPADGPVDVIVYNATVSVPEDLPQMPIKLGAWMPFAYDRFKLIFEQNINGGAFVQFYFTEPVLDEPSPAPRQTLDSWFQAISVTGRRNLFGMRNVVWERRVVTPAPTFAPTGNADISQFTWSILKIEEDMPYDETGVLIATRPDGSRATVCNFEFSLAEAYAACASAGFRTPNAMFRPLGQMVGNNIPPAVNALPIGISHVYCESISNEDDMRNCSVTLYDDKPYECTHQTDVVLDCYDNTRKLPPIEFQGFTDGRVFNKSRFLAGFPAAFNISTDRVLITDEADITSPEGYQWHIVNWTFVDDASVTHADWGPVTAPPPFGPGSGPSGSMGGRDAEVAAEFSSDNDNKQKEDGEVAGLRELLLSAAADKNNKNNHQQKQQQQQQKRELGPSKVIREVASARARYFEHQKPLRPGAHRRYAGALSAGSFPGGSSHGSGPDEPTAPANANWGGFDMGEFTRQQIAWPGRHFMFGAGSESVEHEQWLFQPTELMDYFGVFEMRKNTTRPNGPINSADQTTWRYRLEDTLDYDNHTRCKGKDARCFGRLEVQMGVRPQGSPVPSAPWGSVCSIGATHATALLACKNFNTKIARGLVIPTYAPGQGLIALSNVNCKPGDSWTRCAKTASGHKTKRNRCTHNMDMGVFCGVDVAKAQPMPQVYELTFTMQAWNSSWFPYVFQNFTGVNHSRVLMWDAADTLYYEYWTDVGVPVVKLNLTFADQWWQDPSDYTREDLELYFQLHSAYGLYQLYGIVELKNYGPVPLHVNATLVTSYVPPPLNCSDPNVTCPSTTLAPPTTAAPPTPVPPPTTRAPTTAAPPSTAAPPTTTAAPPTTTAAPPTTTAAPPTTTAAPPAGPTTTVTRDRCSTLYAFERSCNADSTCMWDALDGKCITACKLRTDKPGCTAGGPLCRWSDSDSKCSKTCAFNYLDKASCQADTSCQWVYDDGTGRGACIEPCKTLARSVCLQTPGCELTADKTACTTTCGGKYGDALSCTTGSATSLSCMWSGDPLACHSACERYTNQLECQQVSITDGSPTCAWTGIACKTPCFARHPTKMACNSDSNCQWTATSGKCVSQPCRGLTEVSCTLIANDKCTWDSVNGVCLPPGVTAAPPTPAPPTTTAAPSSTTSSSSVSPSPSSSSSQPASTTTKSGGGSPSSSTPLPSSGPATTQQQPSDKSTTTVTGSGSSSSPPPSSTTPPTSPVTSSSSSSSSTATPSTSKPTSPAPASGAPTSTAALDLTWAVDFNVPRTVDPKTFINQLATALGVSTSVLPYISSDPSSGKNKDITVSFPDKKTRDAALALDSKTKTDMGIVSAAAIENGGTTSSAADGGDSGGPNIAVIAAAAAGGLLLLAVIGFVIYRRKKAARSSGAEGPYNKRYDAGAVTMTDTFENELDSTAALNYAEAGPDAAAFQV